MGIGRWLKAAAMAATLIIGSSLLSSSVQAFGNMPIHISSYARCDATAGTWQVTYWLGNATPATVTIVSASDTATGDAVSVQFTTMTGGDGWNIPLAQREVAGSAPSVGLTVLIKRADRSVPETFTRTHTFPSQCVASPAGLDCVNLANARYKHTFDGAKGTLTVEVVGKPLCPGQEQEVDLEAHPDSWGLPGDHTWGSLTSTRSKISLVVNVPGCRGTVGGWLTDDGSGGMWSGGVLGGQYAPGNRSTGPLARYENGKPACQVGSGQWTTVNCDGSVTARMSVGADAPHPASFQYTEYFEENGERIYAMLKIFSLNAGEESTVTFQPRYLPTREGQLAITVNGKTTYQAYTKPTYCQTRVPPTDDGTPPPRRG